jgi:hypothetical protein
MCADVGEFPYTKGFGPHIKVKVLNMGSIPSDITRNNRNIPSNISKYY